MRRPCYKRDCGTCILSCGYAIRPREPRKPLLTAIAVSHAGLVVLRAGSCNGFHLRPSACFGHVNKQESLFWVGSFESCGRPLVCWDGENVGGIVIDVLRTNFFSVTSASCLCISLPRDSLVIPLVIWLHIWSFPLRRTLSFASCRSSKLPVELLSIAFCRLFVAHLFDCFAVLPP
jgi:hypothetical protein